MKRILVRADDLGYSRAVNYGIYDSVSQGVVNNVGVMINMPTTQMGINLLKEFDIDLGLHTVICAGRPVLPAMAVPSLVDESGYFKTSQIYRENFKKEKPDFVNLDEVVAEIEAQYKLFVRLVGRKPDYFEGHAVISDNFIKGLKIVAEKYDLPLLLIELDKTASFKKNTRFKIILESMEECYNPQKTLEEAVKNSQKEFIPMFVGHPGYLDQELLTHSSLTVPRTKEVVALTSERIKQYFKDQNVKLVRYSQCE